MNDDFTALDFDRGQPSHSFIDKKKEVRINLGRVGSLPAEYVALRQSYGPILLGIQSCGMDQDRLDQSCGLLRLNCQTLKIDLLVTKSDRPFDSQWYFFGDLEGLLDAARDELVRPPFSNAIHHQIFMAINAILRDNPHIEKS